MYVYRYIIYISKDAATFIYIYIYVHIYRHLYICIVYVDI